MKIKHIYRVVFNEPPYEEDEKVEFYYNTLSAIYEEFSVKQIGCKITRLWNVGVASGMPYDGKRCKITRERLIMKTQRNKYIEK